MSGKVFAFPRSERMSDFHEILFPVDISYGSNGGPKWKTAVFTADSGFEARVIDWTNTRAEYDVSMGIQTQAQMDALTHFFYCRRGRAFGFRYKDWNDYQASDIHLGYGDFAETHFQITKTYQSPAQDGTIHEFKRDLRKIAWGSESLVTVNGLQITRSSSPQNYSINYNNGELTTGVRMWGGTYSGMVSYANIDFITIPEGGRSDRYDPPTGNQGATPYDAAHGFAYLNGVFVSANHYEGLRKINVETASEVAQATMTDMNIPDLKGRFDMSGIIAVSTDAKVYLGIGGASNGIAVAKIDGNTLQFEEQWGQVQAGGGSSTSNSTGIPVAPGCVSLDNKTFVHFSMWNNIELFTTSPLQRTKTLVASNGLSFGNLRAGACPYRNTGFGIIYNNIPTDEGKCALYIFLGNGAGGGTGFEALRFGGPTGEAYCVQYDLKTGGLLVFWRNEADDHGVSQGWCGLYHERVGGFVWKRKMPQTSIDRDGNSSLSMQVPINGVSCWTSSDTRFGYMLWFLNTETGELRARPAPAGADGSGNLQTFDPARKFLICTRNIARVISTDITGISYTPPEELRVGAVEFHVGVRFDTDHLNTKHEYWNTQSWEAIPLIEVRNWEDVDLN